MGTQTVFRVLALRLSGTDGRAANSRGIMARRELAA